MILGEFKDSLLQQVLVVNILHEQADSIVYTVYQLLSCDLLRLIVVIILQFVE